MRAAVVGLVALLTWVLLVLPPAPLQADDASARTARTVPEAVEEALEACRDAADDALRALAAARDPDPWLVTEDLFLRDESAVALRFAGLVPGDNGARLEAYAAWREKHPATAGTRDAMEEALAALQRKDYDAVLGVPADVADGVAGVRIAHAQGLALRDLRRFAEAGDTLLDAAATARTLGWLTPRAVWLRRCGGCYAYARDHTASMVAFEAGVAAARDTANEVERANCLAGGACVLLQTCKFGRAREMLDAALAIHERHQSKSLRLTVLLLSDIHEQLGNLERALELQQRALALGEKAQDENTIATALEAMSTTLRRLRRLDEAEACARQALEIRTRRGEDPGAATNLSCLGSVASQRRDYETALEFHEQALEILERIGDARNGAATLANIGKIHQHLGKPKVAVRFWQKAMTRAMRSGNQGMVGYCVWGLASAWHQAGEPERAVHMFRGIVKGGRRLLLGLSFAEVMRAREQAAGIFAGGYLAARDAGRIDDVLFFLESERADGLLTLLDGRSGLEAAGIPEHLAQEEQRLREAEDTANRVYRQARARGLLKEAAEAKQVLERAHAALAETVERVDRHRRSAVADLFPEPATMSDIQAGLAPEEALVVYGSSRTDSIALVVTRRGSRVVDLGPGKPIVKGCLALAAAAAAPGGDPSAQVKRVRELLIEPLALAPTVERLLVSPHGPIALVPLGLVVEECEGCFTPSGTVHQKLRERTPRPGGQVLALGHPEYGSEPMTQAARTRWGQSLLPLPATRDEARAVGDVVLLGPEATETAFRRLASSGTHWRAIHLACHGLIDTEQPDRSVLAVSADEENDGFISALDILRLEIPTELVVLSACETGKGKIYKVEGLVGLTRAFMFAGAPRVLCSLWKVDDEATQALMVKFYELWNPNGGQRGLGAAAALREAQEHVRSHEKWKHPYYWAAWVLWGLPS